MLKVLIVNGLILGGVYSLISMGYSLIYRASGLLSFAQGDIMTLGCYMGLLFYSILGLPFIVSFILTFVCAFAFGMLLERGVIRVLLKKNLITTYIVLATIAVAYIIQNTMQAIFGSRILKFPSVFDTPTLKIIGVTAQTEAWACLVISLFLMLSLHFFMSKTKFGTAMRAAAMDSMAATSCGINTSQTVGVTWGLAAGIASLGGMMLGPIYGVYTMLGTVIGRKGFAGAVAGGYGNMYGAMVGGLLLGLTETLIAGYVSTLYKNLIVYVLLLALIFIKPTGIFNEKAIKDV